MRYRPSYQFGPKSTPDIIKYLIFASIGLSVLATLLSGVFDLFSLFVLTIKVIEHLYLWQFITYLFLIPSNEFTFNYIIHIAFNMYLLWVFGTSIIERLDIKKFLFLFFGSGISAGVVAYVCMRLLNSYRPLDGNFIVFFALLIVWLKQNPSASLHLFFTIPFKAKYLIFGLLGFNLFVDLSNHDFVRFIASITAALFGYLFSWIVMDHINWGFVKRKLFSLKKTKTAHRAKKYDFHTKKPITDDDEFVDAMLAKIAKHGEQILSESEKKRLNEISKKRTD